MQMNLIEANLVQRGSLPLPSAALVIDVRGAEDADVIDRLRIEIADLASEMKVYDVNHWRFLTEFLSFRALSPLRDEDVETIYSQQKSGQTPKIVPNSQATAGSNKEQRGLTGRIDTSTQNTQSSPFQTDLDGLGDESKPFDVFQQHIEELAYEVDRIRTNRIVAVADLNKSGIAGRSVKDATVRIIFLTEAGNRESLITAAAYSAQLKEHFRKLEREGHQPMVSTTVVCLNNSGEAGPPEELIQGLRWKGDWKHIDSLLISEQYREDAALIAGAMQTYLAELLLYVLLIIPPLRVNTSSSMQEIDTVLQIENQGSTNQPKGTWITLPQTTYLVGMAAIEHSVRWGRRWLNYGMVTKAIEVLQNRDMDDDLERRRIRSVADTWLGDWFVQIEQAIPDKIPGNIPALKAIPDAIDAAKPARATFTSNSVTPNISKTSLADMRDYQAGLLRTYSLQQDERAQMRKEMNASTVSPTLQDAVDSIPQIELRLREWEDRDPALKKGTPLVNAQLEAQQILSHPNFFSGVNGSIPRARVQLKELSNAISDFKNTHQQNTLNLSERKKQLEKRGNTMIADFEDHTKRLPLLASFPSIRGFMQGVSFLLLLGLALLVTLLFVTWVSDLIYINRDNIPFLFGVEQTLFEPLFAWIFWVVVGLVVAAITGIFGRSIFGRKRTNMEVELVFWIILCMTALSFLPFNALTRYLFDHDPINFDLLSWIHFLSYASSICLFFAVLVLLIEGVWFIWWRNRLLEMRVDIINRLRTQHAEDIEAVTHFIAETIALQILLRAGLTDGKGGPGTYYTRVDLLYKRLGEINREANDQQRLAADRLELSLRKTQPGTPANGSGQWLNLKIREEWLDIEALTDGYMRMRERMGKETEELKEFAELLLRVMGEELPIDIEQQFREKTVVGSRERHLAQVLMATLVSMAMRFSVAPQSVASMTPIIDRYENIDSQYIHQQSALTTLIDTLRKKVSEATIQPALSDSRDSTVGSMNNPEQTRANMLVATDAFATWGQMLWDNNDAKLEQTLTRSGVLAKLMEDDEYDARAVMRRLQSRTALFGRSVPNGQAGELYLLLSPSVQSRMFRQGLNIPSRLITDFPDVERLVLLYIQRYVTEPLFIPDPTDDTIALTNTVPQSAADAVAATNVAP